MRKYKKMKAEFGRYAGKKWYSATEGLTAYKKIITSEKRYVRAKDLIKEIRRCFGTISFIEDFSMVQELCKPGNQFLSRKHPFHLFFVEKDNRRCLCSVCFTCADGIETYSTNFFPIKGMIDTFSIYPESAVYLPTSNRY